MSTSSRDRQPGADALQSADQSASDRPRMKPPKRELGRPSDSLARQVQDRLDAGPAWQWWDEPSAREPWHLVALLHRAWIAVAESILLSMAQPPDRRSHLLGDTLALVRIAEKPCPQVSLATFLGESKATISRRARRLERAGLVTRQGSWRDGRVSHVTATPDGRAQAERTKSQCADLIDLWFEHIPPEDRELLQGWLLLLITEGRRAADFALWPR